MLLTLVHAQINSYCIQNNITALHKVHILHHCIATHAEPLIPPSGWTLLVQADAIHCINIDILMCGMSNIKHVNIKS